MIYGYETGSLSSLEVSPHGGLAEPNLICSPPKAEDNELV